MDSRATLRTSPCNLCPRECGARRDEGQRGWCGADDDVYVARCALHFWEEPVISGERGSGTVFFVNCPLRCVYCQNYVIARGNAGRKVSVEQLAEMYLSLQDAHALNVNLVTPTHYLTALCESVGVARQRGLHLPIVWNTSGYERVEALRYAAGTVDVYLTDFKYASAAMAERYSRASDYPKRALAALSEMVEQVGPCRFDEYEGQRRLVKGVVVRHLMLPGCYDDSRAALELLYETFGDDVLYSIMNQFTPLAGGFDVAKYPELTRRVPDEDYERLLDFADSLGMEDYFWQDGPAADESFVPQWDGQGVL